MGELRLQLLGKLEIERDGAPVAGLNSAKAQALLCYLAVTGRPLFRPTLAGLLWGNMPDTNARANLRRELSSLRRTLGEHLIITRQEVAFNRDAPYWLDVEAFEAAAAQGTIETLQAAADLYRGDFLEGFYVRDAPAFEEWVLVQGTRLRELALQALHALSVHYAEQGEPGLKEGIKYTSRLLTLEPSREEAHRQLMLLLAQSGQRGAALAQYESCRQALADDLGVEPGPETRELYERIRDGELRRESPHRSPERVVDLPAFLTEARVEPERPVFVARERELTWLEVYLDQALASQGQVAFITGGPGRGKTALMTEFARRAMDQHPELLLGMGNCNAYSGVGDPYLPFREVLAMLTGDVEARWAAGAISRDHARRLWRAVPLASRALLDHGPYLIGTFVSGPGLLSRTMATARNHSCAQQLQEWAEGALGAREDLQQNAIFEQYTNVLHAVAEQCPLLLLLDDLQWTDTASVGLLFHLGRRLTGARILMVGAYRQEEVALGLPLMGSDKRQRHPLEKVLGEFKRQYGDVWLDLGRTDKVQDRRFIDALLATEPNRIGEDFRNELANHTGGHALFTVELMRTMQERGDLVRDADRWIQRGVVDWGTLPARVEAVIEERVARLSPELREILTVASVEGEAFTAQVVGQVQRIGERELLRVLSQELEKRHRLVRARDTQTVDGKRLSGYRFAHALFQQYLYLDLSEGERALLHGEVGTALEKLYEGCTEEIAVQLVRHFAGAGDPERERYYAKAAGERAYARFAITEAVQYLSRALDLTPKTDYDERFALLLAREEVYGFQGDRESQAADLAALDQLIEAFDKDEQSAAKRAEIALRHAKCAEATYDLTAGIKASRMAIDYARTAQDVRTEAEGYWIWGLLIYKEGDLAGARSKFEQGLALAQAVDSRIIEAGCVRAVGFICIDQGDFDESEAYLSKALSISREIGDLLGEARALRHLGSTLSLRDGATTAKDYFQQAIMICRKIGHRSGEADALAADGWQSIFMGDSARSEASLQAALKILHEAGNPDLQANVLGGLGRLYREYTGDFEQARACGEEALRLAQEAGSLFSEAIGGFNIGFALHYQGDYSGAEPHMQRSLGIMCGNRGWLTHGALGRVGVGLNAIAIGEYSAALAHLERARSTFRELHADHTDDDAWAQSALALLYHQLGEDQTAREYATRALTVHRKSGYDYRTATALTRLGHALVGLEDLQGGRAAYQEALDLRRELGQAHLAPEPLAGLARVALAQGDLAQAGAYVEEILSHLDRGVPIPVAGHPLDGTDEPLRIYLTCYRVLHASGDPRADTVLETAHDLLQERAAKIDDEKLRRSYLENVTAHRELVAEWKDKTPSTSTASGSSPAGRA